LAAHINYHIQILQLGQITTYIRYSNARQYHHPIYSKQNHRILATNTTNTMSDFAPLSILYRDPLDGERALFPHRKDLKKYLPKVFRHNKEAGGQTTSARSSIDTLKEERQRGSSSEHTGLERNFD
jgi:S-adenosylmethionine synthetase